MCHYHKMYAKQECPTHRVFMIYHYLSEYLVLIWEPALLRYSHPQNVHARQPLGDDHVTWSIWFSPCWPFGSASSRFNKLFRAVTSLAALVLHVTARISSNIDVHKTERCTLISSNLSVIAHAFENLKYIEWPLFSVFLCGGGKQKKAVWQHETTLSEWIHR